MDNQLTKIGTCLSTLEKVYHGAGYSREVARRLSLSKMLDTEHGKFLIELLEFAKDHRKGRRRSGDDLDPIVNFIETALKTQIGNTLRASEIFEAFKVWWSMRYPTKPHPIQKRVGSLIRSSGYVAQKRGGVIVYQDIDFAF